MHAVCEITLLIRNVILVNIGCVSDIILNVRIYPSFANSTYTSQSSMFLKHVSVIISYHHYSIKVSCASHKVRKKAKIRNRCNQIPHMTQETTHESDNNERKYHIKRAKR